MSIAKYHLLAQKFYYLIWSKPKATHELFLNLDNVTKHKAKVSEYYDEQESEPILDSLTILQNALGHIPKRR